MIYFTLPIAPPAGSDGSANACFIRIRKGCENDRGLIAHEVCHVGQWWRTLGIHSILYLCSKRYKLKCEIEAYQEQLKWPPATDDRPHYAQHYAELISQEYGLSITVEEALKLLE
jgi:hypothetical protein